VLVATEVSAADGLVQRLTAIQLQFGEASGTPAAAPHYFYAVKNGRVTKFASSSGAAIEYLSEDLPGGGAADPQLADGTVFFLQGGGTCVNELRGVSVSGHGSQPVTSPDDGYVITGFASGTGKYSVYVERACDSATTPQAKLVTFNGLGFRHVVNFQSIPPGIVADPVFEPDGVHVDAFVETGTSGYLARFDVRTETSSTPDAKACPAYDVNDGLPRALAMTDAGELWFAVQTGSSVDVWRCAANHPLKAFSVDGGNAPVDVDVPADGSGVLVTDVAGDIWRWDGSGAAEKLTPSVPIDHATW
jgi:hypothetical protein